MSTALFELQKVSLRVRRDPISLPKRLIDYVKGKPKLGSNTNLLKDIDLRIDDGDRIGLIGHNGAGKSTLLRVLAGIYPVTQGTFTFNCQPYGLFSVSQGIFPKANGIDNIYIKGLSLGLSRYELERLTPQIVEFSGLGQDIERPVQQYSAGMRLRLAVAISLSIDTEFLLLDEWIGSGDKTFREKIEGRLVTMLDQSRGMVLATHNHALIKRLCNRCLVMGHGQVMFDGSPDEALEFIGDEDPADS